MAININSYEPVVKYWSIPQHADCEGVSFTSTPPQPLEAVFARLVPTYAAGCCRMTVWKSQEISRLSRKTLKLFNFPFFSLIGS